MEIRQVTVEDLPRLRQFSDTYNRIGSSTFAEDYFQWQGERPLHFSDRLDQPSKSTVAAFDGDRVVAYCNGETVKTWYRDKYLQGYSLHEWFADPTAAGAGIMALSDAIAGCDFITTAGGSVDTMSVFLRLSATTVWMEMTRLIAVLSDETRKLFAPDIHPRGIQILDALKWRDPGGSVTVKSLDRLGEETDHLWMSLKEMSILAVERSAEQLNWRYADHPRFQYDRMLFQSDAGSALMIWRREEIKGLDGHLCIARLCEALGSPSALQAAVPTMLKVMKESGLIFCDFFGTHGQILSALIRGGMKPVVTTPYFDLARLFSPLYWELRKTINMGCLLRGASATRDFCSPYEFYFTKGDWSQDHSNP